MLYNLLLLPSLFLLFLYDLPENIKTKHADVVIGDKTYKVEVADTSFKRSKGLMFRNNLDIGMIFVFKKPKRPYFYNKNVKHALTFFWVSPDLEIVSTSRLPEDTFKTTHPNQNVLYVIELKEGSIAKPQDFVGKKIKIENL